MGLMLNVRPLTPKLPLGCHCFYLHCITGEEGGREGKRVKKRGAPIWTHHGHDHK